MLASFSGRTAVAPPVAAGSRHRQHCFGPARPARRSLLVRRRSSSTVGAGAGSSGQPLDAAAAKQSLQEALQQAISQEDYAAAAQLHRQLEELELQDPLVGLRLALDDAVAEERYQDAARLRDQIREMEELNKPQPPDMTGLSTSSDTVTDGVRVRVRSYYVPAQSRPELGQYFFAYSITITNEGQRVVMLNSRHWLITDGSGKVDHVRGPGVVGEQPILEPGRSFEYQSACPLFTTFGTMEGEYEMVVLDQQGEWGERFEAKIGRFALRKPEQA